MGPPGETALEMARRHVVEAEIRVLRQRALVSRLDPAGGRVAEMARRLLADFQSDLAAHRAHLARVAPPPQG
ncbi:hypothetical protein [Methylobacterium platani]|uniref:Uncharacterized protein n=2 Tax=Methylobacterium platani TaxID=427683 RepID=A0A179RY29_9HYPH|nr:hypothetical protein [Methylobacterium platani]KMO15973.1 hypothetical protein SQ03_15870 [Methylobacterium platani JCM 14648]OAS14232.1 hypothetical protein A5481_30610 [Methylobacterium platani]